MWPSGLRDADEVARGVAKGTVTGAPGLGGRLLEHLGARCPDPLERGVEIVGAEDRRLQRTLRHQRQESVALMVVRRGRVTTLLTHDGTTWWWR